MIRFSYFVLFLPLALMNEIPLLDDRSTYTQSIFDTARKNYYVFFKKKKKKNCIAIKWAIFEPHGK